MKNLLKILIFSLILLSSGFFKVFAEGTIDHFDVKFGKDETSINKAVDLTIEAKDKDGNVVKDYNGTIYIISNTDNKAQLPKELVDNTYTFKTVDQGIIKFENAIVFKNVGKQEVIVIDGNNDNIQGEGTINIVKGQEETNSAIEIKIITPEDGTIIPDNEIKVTGETQKNHKVKIKVNGEDKKDTVSNDNGNFEAMLTDLSNGETIIRASILDADDKEIGLSKEVRINIKSEKPEFKSIKILPSEKVEQETLITIEILATTGLKEVSAIINDEIIKLTEKEGKEGNYIGKTKAPKEVNVYDVDAILINDLGNQTSKRPAAKLEVIPKTLSGAIEKEEVKPEVVYVDEEPKKIYKITNLKLTKLKTKSILTWDSISEAISYNIYKKTSRDNIILVDTVENPIFEVLIKGKEIKYEDFVVEAVIKDENGNTINSELSDVVKIQTGPKEMLILLIISLILGLSITLYTRKENV